MGKVYNGIIIFLAIVSVVLAVVDMYSGLPAIWNTVDAFIYVIFLTDYIVRLGISRDRKTFMKQNVADLLAIIPFNALFRAFRFLRILKLGKLTRIAKFLRFGGVAWRGVRKAQKSLDTNGMKYVLILTFMAVLTGALGITVVENMPFEDSLWWSFVTATTVGYGDLSPETNMGRIIASVLMLVGIGLIGTLTSTITSFCLQSKGSETTSVDKVDMALLVYDALSERERLLFWEKTGHIDADKRTDE